MRMILILGFSFPNSKRFFKDMGGIAIILPSYAGSGGLRAAFAHQGEHLVRRLGNMRAGPENRRYAGLA